ncbi:TonB-dependent receptor [Noviherbaspirillum cavernae]|uniref:TonB-dependent receptor n=1 Tax=Noviherbaspirillum cavernae TaxID=2320862 RepID=A0A418WXI9_9BURK|nr:TonB-dependent receptor [Noviherbaspirillum cavernae]RJG04936.1 TonB-dependent receptor [Noviherbaspirillum cavernae]
MRAIRSPGQKAFAACLISACAGAVVAQTSEEDDLALAYGGKSAISIATGSMQSVARAPAVATVITAQDIQATGATDLDQVLESVPGLHVSVSSLGYQPIYSFRGIFTNYNPQVLMLVNGLPITNVYLGNRSLVWGGMPLENVARIEIIRGPGSALYGADAYAGVINVITKTAEDINGTEVGVRAGSFNTRDAWMQHGGKLGPLDAAFYLRVGKTDGQRGIIQRDSQSAIDQAFGTSASLAPGPVSVGRDTLDARADLAYDNWRFRAGYQEREVGVGAGLAESLDPKARVPETRLYLDLTYRNARWSPNWDVSGVVNYYDVKEKQADPAFLLFPPGAFGGAFPNGVIGNPGHSERHAHIGFSALYSGFDWHRIRFGAGFREDNLYAAPETKNYTIVTVPGVGPVFTPLGTIVDATGNPSLVYLQPHKRHLAYAFAQDEWSLAKDWTLTAGVRHDNYSDFGGTTNPRLALVWDAAYNVVLKAMHGRAFRAPSFAEQYNINNPVSIGNPNLTPETIVTNELAASWQPTPGLQTNLSLFRYRMQDVIRFMPNADPSSGSTAQNTPGQTGRGVELEASWDAHRNLRLSGNLSLQRSTDDATGQDAGLAPRRRLYLHADWRLAPMWQFGVTANHVADRKRQPGDTRAPIADYTTVDLSLRREKLAGNWEVRAMVTNLFNRDAREPSFAPGNIPFDLPLPGRAFYVQLQNRF